jgi:tetratricopeptide (TPR) repeat protein
LLICKKNATKRSGKQEEESKVPSAVLPLVTLILVALPCAAIENRTTCSEQRPTPEGVSRQLEEGNVAFEAGDIAKAEARWTEIRECAPSSLEWPKAVFNLGLLEYRRHNFPEAISYFDAVLQSHPNDKEPGGNLMQTNRNYSNRSAMAISECYEAMGQFSPALRYAWLAKTKYRYYSWCGTCISSANFAMNKRIAYLALRVSRLHILAGILVVGFIVIRWKKRSGGDATVVL